MEKIEGLTEEQIRYMTDRFLEWKLPENFNPDGGISFKAALNENTPWPSKAEPIGTNLFDAGQAEAMVRYMIDGMPARSDGWQAPASGAELIATERQRQIEVEGWSAEHDDAWKRGEIARAGLSYATVAATQVRLGFADLSIPPMYWRWHESWWKPSADPVRNLVKAGALIAAEIDRLQRLAK